MDFKRIDLKQPKYVIPACIYPIVLFLGYMIISSLHTDNSGNSRLRSTSYLNSDLPEAYTDSTLGSKMDNTEKEYGNIDDYSGVQSVENDDDSIRKKEEYTSKYSENEARAVSAQDDRAKEAMELRAMQNRVREESLKRRSYNRSHSSSYDSDDEFTDPYSDTQIARAQRERRRREMEAINRNLSSSPTYNGSDYGRVVNQLGYSPSGNGGNGSVEGSEGRYGNGYNNSYRGNGEDYRDGNGGYGDNRGQAANGHMSEAGEITGKETPIKAVKKVRQNSDYFNTISSNKDQSKLITAIIDENIKAVDGSRVRLRLLDDIEIGDIIVKKGTYLYASMSGFGSQRVKGTVQSIFFHDDIIPVSLSIFDTDGLEGLYVPQSQFRQTAKDVASSAMEGGNDITESDGSTTGVKGWASQAVRNASTKVMNAFGKVFKRNVVRLKYGTKVYLIDSSQRENNNNSKKQRQ